MVFYFQYWITCDSVAQSWDYDLQGWDYKNSHIGILFPILLDYILSHTTLSQLWDYDLQAWDCNQFPHWYFISNIGLRATLFHNFGIMIYKVGTVTNSHIGILFPILDYVRLYFTILGL